MCINVTSHIMEYCDFDVLLYYIRFYKEIQASWVHQTTCNHCQQRLLASWTPQERVHCILFQTTHILASYNHHCTTFDGFFLQKEMRGFLCFQSESKNYSSLIVYGMRIHQNQITTSCTDLLVLVLRKDFSKLIQFWLQPCFNFFWNIHMRTITFPRPQIFFISGYMVFDTRYQCIE